MKFNYWLFRFSRQITNGLFHGSGNNFFSIENIIAFGESLNIDCLVPRTEQKEIVFPPYNRNRKQIHIGAIYVLYRKRPTMFCVVLFGSNPKQLSHQLALGRLCLLYIKKTDHKRGKESSRGWRLELKRRQQKSVGLSLCITSTHTGYILAPTQKNCQLKPCYI